jgi:hypothetical protein
MRRWRSIKVRAGAAIAGQAAIAGTDVFDGF